MFYNFNSIVTEFSFYLISLLCCILISCTSFFPFFFFWFSCMLGAWIPFLLKNKPTNKELIESALARRCFLPLLIVLCLLWCSRIVLFYKHIFLIVSPCTISMSEGKHLQVIRYGPMCHQMYEVHTLIGYNCDLLICSHWPRLVIIYYSL